jgi:hypothetical protein
MPWQSQLHPSRPSRLARTRPAWLLPVLVVAVALILDPPLAARADLRDAAATPAATAPERVRPGAFLTSLSDLDPVHKSFSAAVWYGPPAARSRSPRSTASNP